jgi:hypothetical protein
MAGAEAFSAIRSYLSTAAKQGISILDALTPRGKRCSLDTRNRLTKGLPPIQLRQCYTRSLSNDR